MRTLLLLLALLALTPSATALAEDADLLGGECLFREERCPIGSGTVIATCTNPSVKIPLCFI